MQVDPIKPTLKAPGTKRLRLQYVEPLSNLSFKFNLCRHILAILISALCHDVDHPGLSNKFLLSTREPAAAGGAEAAAAAGPGAAAGGAGTGAGTHPLAARHGPRTVSVVEAHHAFTTAHLLSQPLPGTGDEHSGGVGVHKTRDEHDPVEAGPYTRLLFGSTYALFVGYDAYLQYIYGS